MLCSRLEGSILLGVALYVDFIVGDTARLKELFCAVTIGTIVFGINLYLHVCARLSQGKPISEIYPLFRANVLHIICNNLHRTPTNDMRLMLNSKIFGLALICATLLSCESGRNLQPPALHADFARYWQQGKAELSRYALVQARYGNLNQGELIVITVTEPFNADKQVKSDSLSGRSVRQVLKAQTMRRFTTGIYDYTMTTTSFKPIDDAVDFPAMKITSTSVDWCGQTFAQLNQVSGGYRIESRSYFESEADEDFNVSGAFSEDEIWQRIRLAPEALPQGSVRILPALVAARLRHRRLAPETATATTSNYEGSEISGKNLKSYRLVYAHGLKEERVVDFIFEREFPFKIVGYTEEYEDGFVKPRRLRTVARLTQQTLLDYWATHDPEHEALRRQLGVTGFAR